MLARSTAACGPAGLQRCRLSTELRLCLSGGAAVQWGMLLACGSHKMYACACIVHTVQTLCSALSKRCLRVYEREKNRAAQSSHSHCR